MALTEKRRKVKYTGRKLRTKENIYSSFTEKQLRSNKIAKESGCKNIVIRQKETYYSALHFRKTNYLQMLKSSLWPDTE